MKSKYIKELAGFGMIITFVWFCSCAPCVNAHRMLADIPANAWSKKVMVASFDSVHTNVVNKALVMPKVFLSDSFVVDAATDLLRYELALHASIATPVGYCEGANKVRDSLSVVIATCAFGMGASLIIVPVGLDLDQNITRKKGWRNSKYSGAYEQPISYTARVSVKLAVYDSSGKRIGYVTGCASTERPILFELLTPQDGASMPIEKYAAHLYAPPLLRALNGAIKNAVTILMQ